MKASTIKKCFHRAGICNDDMSSVVSCEIEDDPFFDLDEDTNLQEVINQAILPETCSVHEYTKGDKDVPVCMDINDNSWDETFMLQLQEPTENPTPEKNTEEGNKNEDGVADQAEPNHSVPASSNF